MNWHNNSKKIKVVRRNISSQKYSPIDFEAIGWYGSLANVLSPLNTRIDCSWFHWARWFFVQLGLTVLLRYLMHFGRADKNNNNNWGLANCCVSRFVCVHTGTRNCIENQNIFETNYYKHKRKRHSKTNQIFTYKTHQKKSITFDFKKMATYATAKWNRLNIQWPPTIYGKHLFILNRLFSS